MQLTDYELLKLDSELEEIFKVSGVPKLAIPTRQTVDKFRKAYSAVTKRYNRSPFAKAALGEVFDNPDWSEKNHQVTVRDGRTIKVRTYTPSNVPTGGSAVLVFIRGGGWFMGDLETEALLCQIFCSKLQIVTVNVDYGLYPDVEFGVPQHDCYDAIEWVAKNAMNFGGDPTKGFIVGGNSGGGTYASIAVLLARDNNLQPPVTGCYLTCPILSDEFINTDGTSSFRYDQSTDYRSRDQNRDAPLMTREMSLAIQEFAVYDSYSPLFSPFCFEHYRNHPTTYIAVTGLDPWRDGGLIFDRELRKVGTTTKVDVYAGLPHCWWSTFPQLKATQTWLQNSLRGMRWLLNQSDRPCVSSKL